MYKHFGIFLPGDEPLHIDGLQAFVRGLQRRKLPYRLYPLKDGYQPCDIAVTFGVHKRRTPRGRAIGEVIHQHELHRGTDQHLVIERGFVHRDRYFMVGWGGLNGRANFCNQNSPGTRFRKLRVNVASWRIAGEHVVLCGQIPWDAAVQGSDHIQWCRNTAIELSRWTSRPIIFRPHPLQPDAVDMTSIPVQISTKASLQEDMVNAWAVVTYNSNAGVEATLAGIPAFVTDNGAMGYPILNRDLDRIESPALPDRQQWLFNLAFAQWTLDEIADGRAIFHLWEKQFPVLHRLGHRAHQTGLQLKSAMSNSLGTICCCFGHSIWAKMQK